MDFLGSPDPGSIDRVATVLTQAHGRLTRAESSLDAGVSRLVHGAWNGGAAGAFQGHWATEGSSIVALAGSATQMASILSGLASELRQAMAIAGRAESTAQSHGMTIGPDGSVSGPFSSKPLTPVQIQARAQVQGLVSQARGVANGAHSRAAGALSGISVPQVLPGVTPQSAAMWAQASLPGQPGNRPALGAEIWKALQGNLLPPSALGAVGDGLWAAGRGLTVFGKIAGWMTTVQLGRFAPRDVFGRFVSPGDLSWWE